jgi:hypothetical protein
MAKNYEEVAEMFKSIANLGQGVHRGALSTTRANSDSRKLYAPNSPNTSESMPYSAWNVVGTFADVAPHVILIREIGESKIYHLGPAATSKSTGPTHGDTGGGYAQLQAPISPAPTHSERKAPRSEVDRLVQQIRKTLGDLDAPLQDNEWYSSLALCVIDAVYSINVRYESVQSAIRNFCWWSHWEKDLTKASREYTVSEFIALLEPFNRDWDKIADEVFGNRQRTSPRGGILKAEAVVRFAKVLKQYGIEKYESIPPEGLAYKAAADIQSITGQASGLSYKYFLMNAGNTREVKGDRMITRFVGEAVGSLGISGDEAEDLVRAAADVLQPEHPELTPYKLDNLIWNYQRNQEQEQKAPGSCHRASFGRL